MYKETPAYGMVVPLAIHARLYGRKDEVTADILPVTLPSPGYQSVPVDDPHVPAP